MAMPRLIPARDSTDCTIVPMDDSLATNCYFRLVRLAPGKSLHLQATAWETLCVVLSGCLEIEVNGETFAQVGKRRDIWSGQADSVYAGTQRSIILRNGEVPAEVAIIAGRCPGEHAPFRIRPEEVEMVDVGSADTHSRRRIYHILGPNGHDRCGNLLVSELYADPGCWSGYPPHKHDEERPPVETAFQEIYHYRFDPPSGFGGQYHYREAESPTAVMTRDGDTFIVEDGYHPTSTSPGHRGYILTILVGSHQRSLVQYFDPAHADLLDQIPGLQAMRDKFK